MIFSGTKLGTKAVKSVINSPRFKKALTNFRWNLGPKTWKQGDDAVKMFKTYGTQQPVEPHTSPLMGEIKKYVPEARERYGLVGNTNITDDEIAGSLFVLKDAQQKGEGLLKSAKNSILRDEHPQYNYYALPNFNINGAKSILPYDLNRSTSFIDKGFVYRKSGGKI